MVERRAQIHWGPRDCLRRLIYKLSSQKVVSFVYASGAIFIICWFAAHAHVFTAELAGTAIKAIRDIAGILLVMRGGQSIMTMLKGQGGPVPPVGGTIPIPPPIGGITPGGDDVTEK